MSISHSNSNSTIQNSILTKQEQQKIKKQNQILSIHSRIYVLMKFLHDRCNYKFILQKPTKISKINQQLNYFPILQIYDEKNEIIFDEKKSNISGRRKSEETKKYLIQLFIESLKLNNFKIEETVQKHKIKNKNKKIPLINIISIEYKEKYWKMKELENTWGKEIIELSGIENAPLFNSIFFLFF